MAALPGSRSRLRRTWPQRLVLGVNVLVVLACVLGALGVWYANSRLGSLERVAIDHADPDVAVPGDTGGTGVPTTTAASGSSTPTASTEEAAPADVPAQNFLLVGSDSRDCISPDVANAAAFLGEPVFGGRSDTIMILRVERDVESAAILSFPRDLWVKIADSNRRGRINTAFDPADPSRLVQTIERNFDIRVDHYVDVDFCAFKKMVEVVGGVKIPFAYPTRDRYSGLNVTEPGCVTFDGDAALAYVRSRHYEYKVDGKWKDDPTSDFGRIARQQDFIRRALQKALDRGARQPLVAKQLIDAGVQNVTVDEELTVADLYRLATRLRTFDPSTVKTYRIDGPGVTIGGALVIQPDTTSKRAKAILDYFRGEAGEVDTEASTDQSTTTTRARATTTTSRSGASTSSTTTTTLDPSGRPPELVSGIIPPADPTCR